MIGLVGWKYYLPVGRNISNDVWDIDFDTYCMDYHRERLRLLKVKLP